MLSGPPGNGSFVPTPQTAEISGREGTGPAAGVAHNALRGQVDQNAEDLSLGVRHSPEDSRR